MIILDTSVWIEHLKNNQNYFPKISKLMECNEILAVECVFGELLQGVKNKAEKELIMNFWKYLPKEYFKDIIIDAGNYSAQHKLLSHGVGLIDSIILQYAIKGNSKIWTIDDKFLRIIPEEYLYVDA